MSMGLITFGLGTVPTAQRYWVPTLVGDTIRQRIVDALETRLGSIMIAGGYKTDAGENVFKWRDHAVPEANLPAILFRDNGETREQDTVNKVSHFLELGLQILASGETADETIRQIYGDILQALRVDESFGDLAEMVILPEDSLEVFQVSNKTFGAEFTFQSWYLTDRLNAYE